MKNKLLIKKMKLIIINDNDNDNDNDDINYINSNIDEYISNHLYKNK
jgi:hypothetical protein